MDYLVAFWNLENLFAPEGYPEREPWLADRLRNDLRGWTPELFERKVAQLAAIIARMGDGQGPDLLGVCEVENRHALQALAERLNALLPDRAYDIIHVDAEREQRGIDTAFITDGKRLKPRRKELFSHWVMRRTGTRDITQCTFVTAAGNELIALANHWPSRSAPAGRGPQYSAGFRATAGETLGYWHERIREVKGPDAAILAMGDFNDDPFDASLTIHAGATREQGDVARAQSARFYNLSWRYLTQAAVDHRGKARDLDGTLYFSGDGNVFDQILVARGLLAGSGALRARVESARIEAYPEMVDHRVGEGPIRFGLPKGDAARNVNVDGYSDHFPVSVRIDEAD
ncbi:endonuclease [Achromobacter sp. Marseille-Q0513]|nr:endonuclease [Achromobacter sp.]MBR8654375.1 endonuclease [Achromobacter sp. Marseille-Q0513]